jgi:hypothetical protein
LWLRRIAREFSPFSLKPQGAGYALQPHGFLTVEVGENSFSSRVLSLWTPTMLLKSVRGGASVTNGHTPTLEPPARQYSFMQMSGVRITGRSLGYLCVKVRSSVSEIRLIENL